MNNLDIFGALGHIMFCPADFCLNLAHCKKPVKVEAKFDAFLCSILCSSLKLSFDLKRILLVVKFSYITM